ncbi:RNA polymerase sigma factor RpoD/SigA [candidate division TA06 bacterium]|uniref:RNA polymerase sigma factor RpoD/SigA n=1 Tax=candidate division TA06 bacterium TaxID=2250710 RepID=A0A933I8U8_UNCT6|nr:RNA polymerase sigma factor RpoD/SigA [candidate division TA06 bacterium]
MNYKKISSVADDPSLDIYFKEIGSLAVLTEAQESELALKAKSGNRKALDKLVESNLRFVVSVAKDFQGRGMSMADLINEGNYGLMRAIRRYDPSKGYRFNTYAVWWIRQAILKAIAEQTRSVRLPMNRIDNLNKINKAIQELQAQSPNFGGRPSARQISKLVRIPEDEVSELLGFSSNEVSLDGPSLEGDGRSLGDTMENQAHTSPEQVLKNKTMSHDIKQVLSLLTPREEKIVKMYYGLENNEEGTLDSISRKFNISRERVRQLKERALKKIKYANESGRLRTYLD